MKFSQLALVFNELAAESSRLKMTELAAQVYRELNAQESRMVTYLSLGTLRAPYESSQFNFAQKNLEKVIAQMSHVELSVLQQQVKVQADLGAVLKEGLWPYADAGLSIGQVYDALCSIQTISGTGSQEEKAVYIHDLLRQCDAVSACYIVRIILGTMRLGFSDMTLVDALSWMLVGNKSFHDEIEQAYNSCADLGLIARVLKEHGIEGLKDISITVSIPIRPAAAERAESPQGVIDKIGACVAQLKLDGFRLQIHIDRSQNQTRIWFYSRNLQNMSSMFPDLVEALKDAPVTSLIMEGEAIVFDIETQTFLPFQETVKRKRKHDIGQVSQDLPLTLFLFDILYLNGEPLLDKSHEERRRILFDLFGHYPSSAIRVIDEHLCSNVAELSSVFAHTIERGLEGLVVKRPEAAYKPGKRNFNWIKLKRVSQGQLNDTVDAVVLGYYAGKGKRAQFGVGAFLVGVYNPLHDRFETVAKIGTGLTDLELAELKARCDAIKVLEQPHNVRCAPDLAPDVWVNPEIVVVVLADEITQSPMHMAGKTDTELGLALRFPRFMGYAQDKSAQQATSVDELKRLFQLQFAAR